MSAVVLLGLGASALVALTTRRVTAPQVTLFATGAPLAPTLAGLWPVVAGDHVVPRRLADGTVVADDRAGFSAARYFGAPRDGGRLHAGVDLRAPAGAVVRTIAPGIVLGFPSGYVGLDAIAIDHGAITLIYAEIKKNPTLKVGQKIGPGVSIGTGATSAQGAELHIEAWAPGTAPFGFSPWAATSSAPRGLRDPTALLLGLR